MPTLTVGTVDFYRKDGTKCTAEEWAASLDSDRDDVGSDVVKVDALDAHIYTRFSGIDHDGDGSTWELGHAVSNS